jgi:hypothetical protein
MTMREILDGAVQYWPLVVVSVGAIAGVAVAADKLLSLEQAYREQKTQTQEIQRIQIDQAVTRQVLEHQGKDIEENTSTLKANQALLIQILQKVQ